MTNLRDALEKAAKLSSLGEENVDADRAVQEIADIVNAPSEQSNHPAIDEDRPKLIENEDEFSSVADRISQLVSGESEPNDESAASIEENGDVDPPIAEQMHTAAELTSDPWQLETPDETDIDSTTLNTPATTDFGSDLSSNYADEIKTIDDVANLPEAEQEEDAPTDEQEFASFDPLGLDEQLAIIDEDLQQVEEDAFTEKPDSTIESPESHAGSDEYETMEDDAFEWVLVEEVNENQGESEVETNNSESNENDTETFNPHVIPALRPGNAISTVTTEDEVRDPVTSANELTGAYLPEDLSRVHYSDHVDEDSEQDFDTETITNAGAGLTNTSEATTPGEKPTFLQTTNLQIQPESDPTENVDDSHDVDGLTRVKAGLATAGLAAAGLGASSGEANANDDVDAESVREFTPEPSCPLDTEQLETNAFADEHAASETAVPSRPGQPAVGNEHPIPERSIPTLPNLATSSHSSSKSYEQRILENLTGSQNSVEYNELASSILKSDSSVSPKTICFISADEDTHSPDVVSHVGVVLTTMNEKRVLLVDANDCPDNISRLFEKDKQPGLKNIPNINEDWLDMVLPTAIPNLFLLPSGWNRSNATEWQAGEFSGLVSLFARQFDIILVDAGVAESTEDTPFYAAHDRTLMIVRLGQTDREMATAVYNGLKNSDVQLNGCVITNLPA